MKEKKLPRQTDAPWFEENLRSICRRLKKETSASIALLTLPPIGEDIKSEACRRAEKYSAIIEKVAAEERVALLPFNRILNKGLVAAKKKPRFHYDGDPDHLMYRTLVRYYLLSESFDEISASYNFNYLCDFLHLNSRGAGTAARLIENFIKNQK